MTLDSETKSSLLQILRELARKTESELDDLQEIIFASPDDDWCSSAKANVRGRHEVMRLSLLLVADLLSDDRMAETRSERTKMALDSAIRWVAKFGL